MARTWALTDELSGRASTGVLMTLSSETWACLNEFRAAADYGRLCIWIDLDYPVGGERSTTQATEVVPSDWRDEYAPRTPLGKRLVALRKKAIASGMRLLSEGEVLEEVKRRRGELEDHETDLR